MKITGDVDSVNTFFLRCPMPRPLRPPKTGSARQKTTRPYHHGDLRRALLEEAVRTIQSDGVASLTLRAIGPRLGVSRAALYRHFTDKSALLAAVAAEGFRMLGAALRATWPAAPPTFGAFSDMAVAYVTFAVQHPSHYRVMFGGFLDPQTSDPDLAEAGPAAFQILVDAIVDLQRAQAIGPDDPAQLARYVWAMVHGVAMLTIDRQIDCQTSEVEGLARFAAARLWRGIGVGAQESGPATPVGER
jgi:AcrR family transcriptional regulator